MLGKLQGLYCCEVPRVGPTDLGHFLFSSFVALLGNLGTRWLLPYLTARSTDCPLASYVRSIYPFLSVQKSFLTATNYGEVFRTFLKIIRCGGEFQKFKWSYFWFLVYLWCLILMLSLFQLLVPTVYTIYFYFALWGGMQNKIVGLGLIMYSARYTYCVMKTDKMCTLNL